MGLVVAKLKFDLIGQQFGKLTVLGIGRHGKHRGDRYWICRCECGNEKEILGRSLRHSNVKSCGCLQHQVGHKQLIDLSDKRFGRLTVLFRDGTTKHRQPIWVCLCDCGRRIKTTGFNLRRGSTKSCGCLNRDVKIARFWKHGLSHTTYYKTMYRERKILESKIWTNQMQQCLNVFFPVCVLCGSHKKLATDHVRPLSKGFFLYPGNAVRLCKSCNSRKSDKLPEQLSLETSSRLLLAAEKFRLAWAGGF